MVNSPEIMDITFLWMSSKIPSHFQSPLTNLIKKTKVLVVKWRIGSNNKSRDIIISVPLKLARYVRIVFVRACPTDLPLASLPIFILILPSNILQQSFIVYVKQSVRDFDKNATSHLRITGTVFCLWTGLTMHFSSSNVNTTNSSLNDFSSRSLSKFSLENKAMNE